MVFLMAKKEGNTMQSPSCVGYAPNREGLVKIPPLFPIISLTQFTFSQPLQSITQKKHACSLSHNTL